MNDIPQHSLNPFKQNLKVRIHNNDEIVEVPADLTISPHISPSKLDEIVQEIIISLKNKEKKQFELPFVNTGGASASSRLNTGFVNDRLVITLDRVDDISANTSAAYFVPMTLNQEINSDVIDQIRKAVLYTIEELGATLAYRASARTGHSIFEAKQNTKNILDN